MGIPALRRVKIRPALPNLECVSWRQLCKGSLCGFATIKMLEMRISFREVALHYATWSPSGQDRALQASITRRTASTKCSSMAMRSGESRLSFERGGEDCIGIGATAGGLVELGEREGGAYTPLPAPCSRAIASAI